MQQPQSFASLQWAMLLCGVALLTSACTTHREESASAQPPVYSKVAPTQLMVGRSGDFTIRPGRRAVVRDLDFVRELFATLSVPPTNRFQHYLLIAPYPFVFVDARGDVCGGFLYSASSRPDCVFWPCRMQRRGDDYVITAQGSSEGIVVPGFTDRFHTYMDLTKP